MLDLVFDNRSGNKLEIVLPVYNEEKRIKNLFIAYAKEYDIVLLDGGSTDRTEELAKQYGVTFYKRVGESIGENHFIYYLNNISKSKKCFYMFADEFIELSQIAIVDNLLKNTNTVIYGNRVDWLYCKKINSSKYGGTPRGATSGNFQYDSLNLHNSILLTNSNCLKQWVDVHHLHLWSMKKYFGTAGLYAYFEVEQMRKSNFTFIKFLKRFVFNELVKLPFRLIKNINLGFFRLLWMVVMSHIILLLGIVSFIEQKYLKDEKEQLEFYKKFYTGESNV